jgi:hypothetical protein
MATTTDTLSTPPAPNRVYYSLGRMLGVEDFQADQDYHRGRLARALLQLCGTGTVAGLHVRIPQVWQANTPYAASAFVLDPGQNVQFNSGLAGVSGNTAPVWATTKGDTVNDGTGIAWTNEGPLRSSGWAPNSPFEVPLAIVDSNSNVQVLHAATGFTSGAIRPTWSTAIGAITADGGNATAWTCAGSSQLEIEVTPGMAIDRVGRMIEVPRTVCIRIENWLSNQTASDLNAALHVGNILIDVFATFSPCTSGVTPCFATQDDYDATDAFSANRMLDSFAMQLVLRTDAIPALPKDPWLPAGPVPTAPVTPTLTQSLKQSILYANSGASSAAPFVTNGAPPSEYPPGFDQSSVFLARCSLPALTAAAGQPPTYNLTSLTIDNLSRLFLYPASLVARSVGLNSGSES